MNFLGKRFYILPTSAKKASELNLSLHSLDMLSQWGFQVYPVICYFLHPVCTPIGNSQMFTCQHFHLPGSYMLRSRKKCQGRGVMAGVQNFFCFIVKFLYMDQMPLKYGFASCCAFTTKQQLKAMNDLYCTFDTKIVE